MTNPNGLAYKDGSNGATPDSTYIPQAAYGTNALVYAVGSPISRNNYYVFIQNTSGNFGLGPLAGVFHMIDIQAIDSKMDDGLTNSGNITGWGGDNISNNGSNTDYLENPNGNQHCSTGGGSTQYGINFTYLCGIRIRMGT